MLMCSLIKRIRLDSAVDAEGTPVLDVLDGEEPLRQVLEGPQRWSAHPRTLRLTTRPRSPRNPDGSRPRIFNRISKSCPMPSIVLSLNHSIEIIAAKVVNGSLLPLFRQLHPEESGWDLSLVNVCVTNMALTGTDSKDGDGRDIGRMFRRQDEVLKDWKFDDVNVATTHSPEGQVKGASEVSEAEQQHNEDNGNHQHESEDISRSTQDSRIADDEWDSEAERIHLSEACTVCGVIMPSFAMTAHQRFHSLPD